MTPTTKPPAEHRDTQAIKDRASEAVDLSHTDLSSQSPACCVDPKGKDLERTEATNQQEPGSPMRLWAGTLAGVVVAAPLSWLLGDAAYLPFFLGLFFFALFGLVIGAVTYRVAGPGQPYRASAVRLATILLVICTLSGSIIKESSGFADDVAENLLRNRRTDLGDRSAAEFKTDVRSEVQDFLKDRYATGGLNGYLQWVIKSGEIRETDLASANTSIVWPQRKLWWVIRVVLTLGLLTFGIASQTLGLASRSTSGASTTGATDQV